MLHWMWAHFRVNSALDYIVDNYNCHNHDCLSYVHSHIPVCQLPSKLHIDNTDNIQVYDLTK